MSPRLRKLVGTVVLIVFVPLYALAAMAAAMAILPGHGAIFQGIYYVVAGLIWVIPAGALISWMVRARSGDRR